jgi:hypothetical protein
MAITPMHPVSRSRNVLAFFRPKSGENVRRFPPPGSRRTLSAPRRPGVGHPSEALPWPQPETVEPLVGQAIDLAFESLNRLERQAREVARWFRMDAREEAQNGLRDLMNATQTLVKLAALSAGASDIDLDVLCERRGINAEGETNAVLNELIWYQKAADGQALAATLEQPFAAALDLWRQVFAALGGAPPDPYGHAA